MWFYYVRGTLSLRIPFLIKYGEHNYQTTMGKYQLGMICYFCYIKNSSGINLWMMMFGVLCPFHNCLSYIESMEQGLWKALCNEAPQSWGEFRLQTRESRVCSRNSPHDCGHEVVSALNFRSWGLESRPHDLKLRALTTWPLLSLKSVLFKYFPVRSNFWIPICQVLQTPQWKGLSGVCGEMAIIMTTRKPKNHSHGCLKKLILEWYGSIPSVK